VACILAALAVAGICPVAFQLSSSHPAPPLARPGAAGVGWGGVRCWILTNRKCIWAIRQAERRPRKGCQEATSPGGQSPGGLAKAFPGRLAGNPNAPKGDAMLKNWTDIALIAANVLTLLSSALGLVVRLSR
jgi:hypothetical protein